VVWSILLGSLARLAAIRRQQFKRMETVVLISRKWDLGAAKMPIAARQLTIHFADS